MQPPVSFMTALAGFASPQVGDLQCEHAGEGVHPDVVFGPVAHRGERHDVWVFELPEAELGVGLGAVGRDYFDDWPVVAVGSQDPFAVVRR